MNRIRPLLSFFLGFVLLAQGFAVSAAPRTVPTASASASETVMADMPCHGQMAARADEGGAKKLPCCNENCPDMATCALGHLAPVTTVSLTLPPPAPVERAFMLSFAALQSPGSLLRPPIASHG